MQISLTFSLFHKSRKRVIIFPEIRAKIFHTGLATVSLRSLWVFPRQLGGYLVSSNNLLFGAIIFVFRPDSKLSSSFFWNLSWSRANPPRRTIFPIYDYFISLKGRQKRDLGQDIFRILRIILVFCQSTRLPAAVRERSPRSYPNSLLGEERRPDSRKQRKSSLLFILLVYSLETALLFSWTDDQ